MLFFFFFFFFFFLMSYLYKGMKIILSSFLMFMNIYILFKYDFFVEWINMEFMFGMNIYSYMLLFLSNMIINYIIMILNFILFENMCVILFMILLLILFMIFMSLDLMNFYFYYEISLILTFMIIMYWGLGSMRLMSNYYFMFYMLFFSLPLLMFIFYMIMFFNVSIFFMMEMMFNIYNLNFNMFMFMYMMLSFFIKIPMYMFHGWLLKAHVEAPVFGSMILASILLKMGTYGLLRFMYMMYMNFMNLKFMLMIFSLMGSIIISINCIRQIDMKVLVAYSSVVHMGMLLCGMMTFLNLGLMGSYMMMISHGICSSGLFYLVNVCYKESNSRLMILNKGFMMFMPSMTLIWFMLCSSNMSAPISLNLISEVFLLMSLVNINKYLILLLMILCFFSFLYSLYLFSYVQHGEMNFYMIINSNNLLDFFILLMHWIILNILFLNLLMFNF
uniref:NADH-ubiquinone oxidoreductase chain 4 n=1 Tax=Hylaeus dilatatus TaxID=1542591 RepID=A0A0U1YW97_9HYME|nr:NADH dehydrogenase subunit 4 [Hylaeus dilatatus]AJG02947.1 NADH dehydrogenase subunit 4 [Hylaeus dilatatus]